MRIILKANRLLPFIGYQLSPAWRNQQHSQLLFCLFSKSFIP